MTPTEENGLYRGQKQAGRDSRPGSKIFEAMGNIPLNFRRTGSQVTSWED